MNLPISEHEYMEIARRVMEDETAQPVVIRYTDMRMLVSGLQLCTRHPALHAPLKERLTQIARQFQEAITLMHPEAGPLIEMGWNSDYDQEST